jgi:hypothetical protein
MRIVGIGVCGPGEANRYMRATLDEFKRLCDDVLIACCNATNEEKKLLEEYGFSYYEDNREWGTEQPNIKTDLLTKAGSLQPDWIIALDMDETFAPEFTREEAERLGSGDEIAWYFLIVNLYNDREHFAHDVGIQRFWNIRFFKFLPEYGLQYQKKNLHCGLAPPFFYTYGWHAPYYVEHFGLMLPEDRAKKVERYKKYDPNKRWKGGAYYDDLARELKPHVFDRPGLLRKLAEAPDTQKRELPHSHPNSKRNKK